MARGPLKRKPADVYVIVDDDGKPRYVGQTTQLRTRVRRHHDVCRDVSKATDSILDQWLVTLTSPPRIYVLQRAVPFERRHAVEAYWTTVLRQGGADLLNVATGATLPPERRGHGTTVWTPEMRREASRRGRERTITPGTTELARQGGRQAMDDPEKRRKAVEGGRDAWKDPAVRERHREGMRRAAERRRMGDNTPGSPH